MGPEGMLKAPPVGLERSPSRKHTFWHKKFQKCM